MAWDNTEPKTTTEVSVGLGYIRNNWVYLETLLKKTLNFDGSSGSAADDGYIKGSQYAPQTLDPAIALANSGIIYGKVTGGTNQPTFRNNNDIYKMVLSIDVGSDIIALPNGVWTDVYDWNGKKGFVGYALAYDIAAPHRTLFSPIHWSGTVLSLPYKFSPVAGGDGTGQLSSGVTYSDTPTTAGQITKFQVSGTKIQIYNRHTANVTVRVRFFGVII